MGREVFWFNSRLENRSDILTFDQISSELLKKPNCAIRDGRLYIQDLHGFVQIDIDIVEGEKNPKLSTQCKMIKEFLLYLLNNFDSFKTGAVNIKIK